MVKYPLLTAREEKELGRRRDSDSRELLINSNLRMVLGMAMEYPHNGDLEDLVQCGNIGLIKAVDKFDSEKGTKFSTYAHLLIKKEMIGYLKSKGLIALPDYQTEFKNKIYKIINQYVSENGKKPSLDYVADELKKRYKKSSWNKKELTGRDIGMLFHMHENLGVRSLSDFLGNSDLELMATLFSEDGRDNFETLSDEPYSTHDMIYGALRELDVDDVTKNIVWEVLFRERDFKELSLEFNLTPPGISYKYAKGMKKLRTYLDEEGLSDELLGKKSKHL